MELDFLLKGGNRRPQRRNATGIIHTGRQQVFAPFKLALHFSQLGKLHFMGNLDLLQVELGFSTSGIGIQGESHHALFEPGDRLVSFDNACFLNRQSCIQE